MDALRRDRPHARQAAGDAHEPQPAILRLVLGGPQEPDALDLADRRLRRPLCRRDVPGRRAPGRCAVHAVGARLTDEIAPTMVNYGHLHIVFDDGSVGWYEAGWGPMMSETAFFVKDMIGPKGAVSIVAQRGRRRPPGLRRPRRAHPHRRAPAASRRAQRRRELRDRRRDHPHRRRARSSGPLRSRTAAVPRAIRERRDLSAHLEDALNSLRIVFAADESIRTGEVVLVKTTRDANGGRRISIPPGNAPRAIGRRQASTSGS